MQSSKSFIRRGLRALVLAGCVLSAGAAEGSPPLVPDAPASLRWFGFAGVACGIDDPHDGIPRLDYISEVAPFSNFAHVCAHDPTDAAHLAAALDRLGRLGLRAILDVQGIFFERAAPELGGSPPSKGPPLVLRADAAERWAALAAAAGLGRRFPAVAAVIVADEPTWNGIPPEDVSTAVAHIERTLPGAAHLLIEAWPVVDRWVIPPEIDWVGFNRYGIADPLRDAAYRAHLENLLTRRSRPDQRLFLIFESRWLPAYGGQGLEPEALAEVTRSYYELARRVPEVIGMAGYLWPGGYDEPGQLGARNLPPEVLEVYQEIGAAVTGVASPARGRAAPLPIPHLGSPVPTP